MQFLFSYFYMYTGALSLAIPQKWKKFIKIFIKNTNIDLKESIKIILQTLELNIYIIKPLKGSKIHGSDLYVSRHKLLLTNLFSREIDMPYLSCKIQRLTTVCR